MLPVVADWHLSSGHQTHSVNAQHALAFAIVSLSLRMPRPVLAPPMILQVDLISLLVQIYEPVQAQLGQLVFLELANGDWQLRDQVVVQDQAPEVLEVADEMGHL